MGPNPVLIIKAPMLRHHYNKDPSLEDYPYDMAKGGLEPDRRVVRGAVRAMEGQGRFRSMTT